MILKVQKAVIEGDTIKCFIVWAKACVLVTCRFVYLHLYTFTYLIFSILLVMTLI